MWVVNCNLQRLDGPVRGNGKIVQELETVFRGAGWNVIKVVWGREWDPLLAADAEGLLRRRLNELLDGHFQKMRAEGGAYIRKHLFGTDPRLLDARRRTSTTTRWAACGAAGTTASRSTRPTRRPSSTAAAPRWCSRTR